MVVSYIKIWVNYGWTDEFSRSLNTSRILKFAKTAGPRFKNFGTGAESESEKVTAATFDPSTSITAQSTPLVVGEDTVTTETLRKY